MAGYVRFDRLILTMTDEELEMFCREWVEKKSRYFAVRRFGGSGDLGRDVVGFHTDQLHDGPWDNYQCKQYRRGLDQSQGLLAVGKVFYWASIDSFTLPNNFYFVAPKGVSSKLDLLLQKPEQFKHKLLSEWGTVCENQISRKFKVPLSSQIIEIIKSYDYRNIHLVTIDEMLSDPAAKPLLIEKFGVDPGKYPPGAVPTAVQLSEQKYIKELVGAYRERSSKTFISFDEVLNDEEYGPDLKRHRVRFFEADAFQKFYRDNTSPEVVSTFRSDVQYAVIDRWQITTADTLARIYDIMAHAGTITCAGPLAQYGHVQVKQGMCHHFVNDGEMSWKKKK